MWYFFQGTLSNRSMSKQSNFAMWPLTELQQEKNPPAAQKPSSRSLWKCWQDTSNCKQSQFCLLLLSVFDQWRICIRKTSVTLSHWDVYELRTDGRGQRAKHYCVYLVGCMTRMLSQHVSTMATGQEHNIIMMWDFVLSWIVDISISWYSTSRCPFLVLKAA